MDMDYIVVGFIHETTMKVLFLFQEEFCKGWWEKYWAATWIKYVLDPLKPQLFHPESSSYRMKIYCGDYW